MASPKLIQSISSVIVKHGVDGLGVENESDNKLGIDRAGRVGLLAARSSVATVFVATGVVDGVGSEVGSADAQRASGIGGLSVESVGQVDA